MPDKIKVLVVEDEAFLSSLIKEALTRAGFSVDLAIDGDTAFNLLSRTKPDIILLDLILPGISGFDILKKLKEDEQTKAIPVIIISNLGSTDEIQKGLDAGADAYLIKAQVLPVDIINKIREILKNRS